MKPLHLRRNLQAAFLIVLSAVMLLSASPVQGLSNVGPDAASFSSLPYRNYHLSNSNVVKGVTELAVPIYFLTSGNINDIPAGGVPITVSYISGPSGSGISSGSGNVQFGASAAANIKSYTSAQNTATFTIPRSAFILDPSNGRLGAFIHGRLVLPSSEFRSFRLTAPGNYWIGFSSDAGSVFSIGNRDRCENGGEGACGNYYNYSMEFAPPCIAGSGSARITLRDVDLPRSSQTNPQWNIYVRYRVIDVTAVPAVSLPLSSSMNYADGATSTIDFNYIGTHKYRFEMLDVYANNVIQFKLPFDSIYFYDPCPKPTQWAIDGLSTRSTAFAQPGTPISWNHTVRNQGPQATDKPVAVQVQRSFDGGTTFTSEPVVTIPSGRPVGQMFADGNGYTPTGSDVGKVICERVTYTPRAWNDPFLGSEPWACITITATPRISIVGGDAVSGGNTACTVGGGGFRGAASSPGSFGEYGVLSTGNIIDFYSAGKTGGEVLTFANKPPTPLGNFSGTRCLTDLTAGLTDNVTSWNNGFISGQTIPGGINNFQPLGDISIAASTLNAGSKTIINAPGRTVRISGNIKYNDSVTYPSFKEAPSLVILANRIVIDSNVDTLDGLFIASQNFTTCREAGDTHAPAPSQVATMAIGGACRSTRLTINGALIVGNQLVTARSIGGGSASEPPAEIIRFRPEVFLTPYEKGAASGSLMTDIETELPPRN